MRWMEAPLECSLHEEGETCDCDDELMTRVWHLTDGIGIIASIQNFANNRETFYGTWADGRTGPVDNFEACKALVESKVRPQ